MTNPTPKAVSAENVEMQFGDLRAVKDANFELKNGQFVTFLSPSGSGKTTLLRMIVGFLTLTKLDGAGNTLSS